MGSNGHVERRLDLSAPLPVAPHASLWARSPAGRAGVVVAAGALAFAAMFSPVKLCVVALVLGVPCPGCGMTRATFALLRGDFTRAFAIHPLSPVVAPFAAGLVAMYALRYFRTGDAFGVARVPRVLEIFGAALVVLLFAVWIARFCGFFGGPVALS